MGGWARSLGRILPIVLVAVLLVALGCHGGGSGSSSGTAAPPVAQPGFTLAVTPPTLSLASGANASVTVAITRFGGFAEAVTLGLENPPAGVVASGSIAAGAASGLLQVGVQAGLPPQSFPALAVTGKAGSLSFSVPFTLTVASGSSVLPVDRVQGSGVPQHSGNGAIENQPVAGEAVRAVASTAGQVENRSGYAFPR